MPDEDAELSPVARETVWRRDLLNFGKGAFHHWGQLLTGTLMTAAVFVGAVLGFDVSASVASLVGISFLFGLTCFLSWRDKQREVEKLQSKVQSLLLRERSLLKVSCGKEILGCATDAVWQGNVRVIHFRIKVEAKGLEPIVQCKGQLLEISKGSVPLWGEDSPALTFAPARNSDTTSKTIRQDVPEFLDVLVATEKGEVIPATVDFQWFSTVRPSKIFEKPDAYRLTIVISAHNSPSKKVNVKFDWTGRYDTATLTMIPDEDQGES